MTETLCWRKSSYSGTQGECVELARVPRGWRKSSYSGSQGECVELATEDDKVLLRNSNHPAAGTLALTSTHLAHFLHAIKTGYLDDLP